MRKTRPRGRRARFAAVSRPAGQAHLRERVEGGVAGVAQAPDDARQRESVVARRCPRAEVARGADGAALLRRRRRNALRLRAAEDLTQDAPPGTRSVEVPRVATLQDRSAAALCPS